MGWTFYNASGEALVQHAESEAVQSEMEAETAVAKFVPPDLVKNSPGVAKFWVKFDGAGGSGAIDVDYNVDSVSDDGAGDYTVTITTDFSGAHWAATANARTAGAGRDVRVETMAAGTLRVLVSATSAGEDATYVCVAGFGDQ